MGKKWQLWELKSLKSTTKAFSGKIMKSKKVRLDWDMVQFPAPTENSHFIGEGADDPEQIYEVTYKVKCEVLWHENFISI